MGFKQIASLLLLVISESIGDTILQSIQNKTKRTIAPSVHNYGEGRPWLLYTDSNGVSSDLVGLYAPVTLGGEPPKVAAQQVLYEFQQTPTNAFSNVHVNQYYQPKDILGAQQPASAESIAAPVQHSSLIRHGQNYAQVQYHPLVPQQVTQPPTHLQTQHYIPGKYLYVNGKIVYQPTPAPPPPPPPKPTLASLQRPPFPVAPISYSTFHPPHKTEFKPITKPINTPAEVREEQRENDENEESAPKKEAEEDEEEDDAGYEEDDDNDDRDTYFGRYRYEDDGDDDDDDHRSYYNNNDDDDDDDDSDRGSSRVSSKSHKGRHKKSNAKNPGKYSKSNNFKFRENYSSSSRYEKPNKHGKKIVHKSPKMHYKSVHYSRQNNERPRIERIEGKQSQNIPVVHKQKIFKEKWFVSKSTDDSL